MIVVGPQVAEFVSAGVGRQIFPPYEAMGIAKDGRIIAGCVFNCYTGNDIHVTIAGHGWTKGFLASVGDYAFRQLGCTRITAITEQPAIVRIAERLGGRVEGLLRDHFGVGRSGYLLGILKADYRF